MATATTAAEPELKTYWCHECDMSVALTLSPSPTPSPLLCPHCHTHFLELMDSPFPQNDAAPFPSFLFDSPLLHRLIHHHHHHLISTDPNHNENDVVEDPLALLSPSTLTSKTASSKTSLPVIAVTSSLLSQLDPNGVVFCAVCKDQIAVDAEAKQLPCNHLYHSDCVTPWLAHHDSCPLCRFRLAAEEEEDEDEDDDEDEEEEEEGEDEDGASSRAREIRRQLRAAMVRLSELMEEEEEEDFYGLRTTLNHIASRHGLLDDSNGSRVSEENRALTTEVGSPIDGGGDEQQTAVTG